MTKCVSVTFSDDVYDELLRIADEQGKTLDDVLRDAVSLEKYSVDARREGGRLLAQKADGELYELRRDEWTPPDSSPFKPRPM